ncbi:hypothetical protein A20C1_11686 [marine actinobacterium PHSC20C1]|nr:hypothetical protein A20C1_11686 [marine actinobacterium PHSC20C1]
MPWNSWTLCLHRDSHRTSSARDDLHCAVDVVGVEVSHLLLGDRTNLVFSELCNLDGVRRARSLGNSSSLLDELCGRRGLEDERERTVLVHGDLNRDNVSTLCLGCGVVRLAELHDVNAVLTQRRPDGRCGVGGAGLDLKLNQTCNLLFRCHYVSFTVRTDPCGRLSRTPTGRGGFLGALALKAW